MTAQEARDRFSDAYEDELTSDTKLDFDAALAADAGLAVITGADMVTGQVLVCDGGMLSGA